MSGIAGLSGAFQIASTMINRASAAVDRDAAAVAGASGNTDQASPLSAGGDSGNMLSALLDSRQQSLYAQAGARMLETSSQMMGSLLDVTA